jgi:hypothetical protein
MKKLFLVVAVVLVAAISGNAQNNKWNLGVGGGLALPTGDASDFFKAGFNGFVNGTYNFTPKFAAGVELNYMSFSGKKVDPIFSSFGYADVNISAFLLKGVYTFTEEGIRPYVSLSAGMYSSKSDVAEAEASNKFGYAAGVGAKFNKVNIGLEYHMAGSEDGSSFDLFQINVGYTFTF